MLSRVADSLYWINRYVERAENISRFVEVSEAMALDCPPGSAEPWLMPVAIGNYSTVFIQKDARSRWWSFWCAPKPIPTAW
jgi:uncharacterized alpha-E superfamily protein